MDNTAGYDTTLDITTINGNYATLVYMILNPLQVSTGSSLSLRIVTEACFKNFDLAVPTPRFVTWQAQVGGMINPLYEDFDKLAREYGVEAFATMSPVQKERFMRRVRKYLPYVGTAVTMTGLLIRIGFCFLTGEDVGDALPFDHVVRAPSWEPQSGILDGLGKMATGLLDSTASGLKHITADAIDSGRALVREYTGLHNPNVPTVQERVITTSTNFVNNTDSAQFFEKLDPLVNFNRVVQEPIFGSDVDEMAVSHIVTKKQFLGTIKVRDGDPVGALKWIRPISPFQGGSGTVNPDASITCYNNLELMHTFSRAWRGGLKLTIQSVMNNKQQCKLKVIKMYNPSVKALTQVPAYKSIVNAPTHLLEFTQGGQELEVQLPYLCRNDLTPCMANMDSEALFHGMYYVYVAQPLVISDASPTEVEFNLFLSGEPDLTFYGYTTSNTYHDSYSVITGPVALKTAKREKHILHNVTRFKPISTFYTSGGDEGWYKPLFMAYVNIKEKDDKKWTTMQRTDFESFRLIRANDYREANDLWEQVRKIVDDDELYKDLLLKCETDTVKQCTQFHTGLLNAHKVLRIKELLGVKEKRHFAAQTGSLKVMNEPQKQTHVYGVDSKEQNLGHMTRLMPNLDIRNYIRRMYKSQVYQVEIGQNSTNNVLLPLASFVGEDPANWNYTPIETFSRMYYGKTVGFKFRCMITLTDIDSDTTLDDVDFLNLRVYYLPQNLNALATTKIVGAAPPNSSAFTGPFAPTLGIPLPFQILAKETTSTHVVYEFLIPDTSFYKFMGGPMKFNDFAGSSIVTALAQADFGTIVMQLTNLARNKVGIASVEMFTGLTDESRFGYHSMAPPFRVFKATAFYSGTNSSAGDPVTATLNPYVYKGSFL